MALEEILFMSKFWWNSALLALVVGCGQPPVSNDTATTPAVETSLPDGAMLVTLKLPEMT